MFRIAFLILIYSNITVLLFSLYGCSGMQGVTKKELSTENIYEDLVPWKLPANQSPVSIVNLGTSKKTKLDKNKYVELGYIGIEHLMEACYKEGGCKDYRQNTDTTRILLDKAASYGGTHVILEKDNELATFGVSLDTDECADADHYGVSTNYDSSGNYSAFAGVIREQSYCNRWAINFGKGKWKQSSGSIWRYDPVLAKKVTLSKGKMDRLVTTYVSDLQSCGREEALHIESCCGYKDPLTGAFVIEPIFSSCSPFYNSYDYNFRFSHKQHYPDHAFVASLYRNRYGINEAFYITNKEGEGVKSCSTSSSGPNCSFTNKPDPKCFRKEEDTMKYCTKMSANIKLRKQKSVR